MEKILEKYERVLSRPTAGIVHFSDVFAENQVDFDSELTAIVRNLGSFSDLTFPIGHNPKLGDYGVTLLNDLIAEQKRILEIIENKTAHKVHCDFSEKAVLSILNCAPRNNDTTVNGKNGEDFYLAITDNYLEIYAVPVANLQSLETRNKILALYRIPTEKLQTTDGHHEQFRSSIVATMRYFPEVLEPVFQYENCEELILAKSQGTHPNIIPEQKKLVKFAFADKFGNVRVSVKDNSRFKEIIKDVNIGDIVKIRIGQSEEFIEAHYVNSLKEISDGELGIYQNVADENNLEAGYWEIVRGTYDCNNESRPAVKILEELNDDFRNEEIFVSKK